MGLTDEQRRHVEEWRDKYLRKYMRVIMIRYKLDRTEALSAIDMGMVKAATHWAEGVDLGPIVYMRARSEAFRAMLRGMPLSMSQYAARVKQEEFGRLRRSPLYDHVGSRDDEATDDLEWLANEVRSLTPRQRRSLYSRKQNSPIRRQAIAILRARAAETLG